MLPADELSHADLVAVRFELQAAQYVRDLTAEFTRVERVPPNLGKRVAERLSLVPAKHAGHLRLTARHDDDMARMPSQGEADGVVGSRIACVQCRYKIDGGWQPVR